MIARWGRYKVFPILGTATMTLGLYLLSLMSAATTHWQSSLYMLVLGLGLGLVMQVLVVAVQNAVPYRFLGTATSAATFFRSIGGSFGVAVFGAIFTAALRDNLPKYLPPQALARVPHGNVDFNPEQLKALPAPIHDGFVEAFAHSLQTVFLVGVPFALLAFVLTWFLKEVPLRTQAHTDVDTESAAAASADLPGGRRRYGRTSNTRLNGVSAARRNRVNPAERSRPSHCSSLTWLPSATPPSSSPAGVQIDAEPP